MRLLIKPLFPIQISYYLTSLSVHILSMILPPTLQVFQLTELTLLWLAGLRSLHRSSHQKDLEILKDHFQDNHILLPICQFIQFQIIVKETNNLKSF